MNVSEMLFSAVIEAFRTAILVFYTGIFFLPLANDIDSKRKRSAAYLAAYLIPLIAYILAQNVYINVVATFLSCLIVALPVKAGCRKKLFFAFFLWAVSIAVDYSAGFLFSKLSDKPSVNYLASIISVILFLLSALLVKQLHQLRDGETLQIHFYFLLLILLSGVGTVIILTLEEELSQKACLFIGGTFLSLDFMVFFLYETLISNAQKEKDQIFLLEQTKAYEQLITDSRENDRKIRSLRHDMKNHLAEIGELARLGKTDEILQYIGYAARELADATPQVSTGVVGLDGILNYKIREAAANGIFVKKKIAVPDSVGISAYEMNIIIGNLLDNAIRAVTEIEGDNRLISILIRYEKRVLYIRIENACDETKIVDYRGRLISTKNESDQSHGIGIMNVKRTVDKMNGMFTTEHGEGFFIATVIIPEKT